MSTLATLLSDLRLEAGYRAVTEAAFLRAVTRVWEELLAEQPQLNAGFEDVAILINDRKKDLPATVAQVLQVYYGTGNDAPVLMSTTPEALDKSVFGWRQDTTVGVPTQYYVEGVGGAMQVGFHPAAVANATLRVYCYKRLASALTTSSTVPGWVISDELFLAGARAKLAPQLLPSMAASAQEAWLRAKQDSRLWKRTFVDDRALAEDTNSREGLES